jgi:hypothetical protein
MSEALVALSAAAVSVELLEVAIRSRRRGGDDPSDVITANTAGWARR